MMQPQSLIQLSLTIVPLEFSEDTPCATERCLDSPRHSRRALVKFFESFFSPPTLAASFSTAYYVDWRCGDNCGLIVCCVSFVYGTHFFYFI